MQQLTVAIALLFIYFSVQQFVSTSPLNTILFNKKLSKKENKANWDNKLANSLYIC